MTSPATTREKAEKIVIEARPWFDGTVSDDIRKREDLILAITAALAAEREAVLSVLASRGWDQALADLERYYEGRAG